MQLKRVKVCVLGDKAVGKSCLLARYCRNTCGREYQPSVGYEVQLKRLELGGERVVANLWDVASSALDSPMLSTYLHQVQLVLVLYDCTAKASFDRAVNILQQLFQQKQYQEGGVKVVLVSNKLDLLHLQEVKAAEHNAVIHQYSSQRLFSYNTSALSGENVQTLFGDMLAKVLNVVRPPPNTVSIQSHPVPPLSQQPLPKNQPHPPPREAPPQPRRPEPREVVKPNRKSKNCLIF